MNKLVKIFFRNNTTLDALYSDGKVKRYDLMQLADCYPQLKELKNRELFLKGKILGTSGIKWNDELDIDADTIYSDGKDVTIEEPIENYLLGFELKAARIKNEFSQQDVSIHTGIEQSDISRIENGNANPTLQTLRKLCNHYNKQLKINLI